MKAQNLTLNNQLANTDLELLSILKADIKEQSAKITRKLLNMATLKYDSELLAIIKEDITFIKSKMCNQQNNLAKAS